MISPYQNNCTGEDDCLTIKDAPNPAPPKQVWQTTALEIPFDHLVVKSAYKNVKIDFLLSEDTAINQQQNMPQCALVVATGKNLSISDFNVTILPSCINAFGNSNASDLSVDDAAVIVFSSYDASYSTVTNMHVSGAKVAVALRPPVIGSANISVDKISINNIAIENPVTLNVFSAAR